MDTAAQSATRRAGPRDSPSRSTRHRASRAKSSTGSIEPDSPRRDGVPRRRGGRAVFVLHQSLRIPDRVTGPTGTVSRPAGVYIGGGTLPGIPAERARASGRQHDPPRRRRDGDHHEQFAARGDVDVSKPGDSITVTFVDTSGTSHTASVVLAGITRRGFSSDRTPGPWWPEAYSRRPRNREADAGVWAMRTQHFLPSTRDASGWKVGRDRRDVGVASSLLRRGVVPRPGRGTRSGVAQVSGDVRA